MCFSTADPSLGVSVTYKGGTPCDSISSNVARSSTFEFVCDPEGAQNVATKITLVPSTTCTKTVRIETKNACAVVPPVVSPGAVAVIILLTLGVVYLFGGMLFKNKMYGTSGMESIPNIDFWRSLPDRVRGSHTSAGMDGHQSLMQFDELQVAEDAEVNVSTEFNEPMTISAEHLQSDEI